MRSLPILNRPKHQVWQPLPASPTDRQMVLIHELRRAVGSLPPIASLNPALVEQEWIKNESRLRQLLVTEDPREFLSWPMVVWTIFVANQAYVGVSLRSLQLRGDWKSRWEPALRECWVGSPRPYKWFPESSGNLIHQADLLAQFEECTDKRIEDVEFIFEFGGGYGSMSRLAHNLGFRGDYVLFDLPAFSLLQQFFLKSIGVMGPRVHCISDLEELGRVLQDNGVIAAPLFVAMWSICEVPTEMRERILGLVSSYDAFLILYQERFAQTDNIAFFRKWTQTQEGIDWFGWELAHQPGVRYLIGVRD